MYVCKRFVLNTFIVFCTFVFASSIQMASAQTIKLKTENYPPFNMESEQGRIIGISTEIVEQLFERAGVQYELELLPWQRAFGMALEEADTAVFSTTRTEERENKFKWVGPLVENNWVFLAKENSNIEIASLDEAKQYSVGGYQGDATALFLADQGFVLDLTPKDDLNARKIDRNRIDLWATGHLLGPYYAKQQGVLGLEPVLTFRRTIMSIAFNKNTSDDIINALNDELQRMKDDGTVAQIEQNYQ